MRAYRDLVADICGRYAMIDGSDVAETITIAPVTVSKAGASRSNAT